MEPNSDNELIAAALAGSERAWAELVRRHQVQVYNLGLRLTGNCADAHDLTQESFVAVFRNLHRFRADARFSSWLYRIVHNKAMDLFRRRRLTLVSTVSSDEGAPYPEPADDVEPGPQQALLSAEQNDQVMRLLAGLPLNQRLLVELKVYQGLTFEEIAEIQQISSNTAKTRFYSALRKLRATMEASHVLS